MEGFIAISDSSSDDDDHGFDSDDPPVADAYRWADNRKGKESRRKWWSFTISVFNFKF